VHRHKRTHLHLQVKRALATREAEAVANVLPAIARREERIQNQQDRYERMQRVIVERGEDPSMQDVPGGRSGLLVRKYKQIGSGDNVQLVEEYTVDAPLLKEVRELEKHVTEELGQYNEGAAPGQHGPTVIIVRPPVEAGQIPAELPVAQTVQFPDGAPREILEAEWSELPEPGPGNSESEEAGGDDGAVENRAQAAYEVFRIADFE